MYTLRSKKELRIFNIIKHNYNNNVIKELKQKVSARRTDFQDTGKDKTRTIKIKCPKQTPRNITYFLCRNIPMCKNAPTKEETELLERSIWNKKP
jgi:hypothetical protein